MNNDFKSYKKVIVPAKHRFFGEDSERDVEAYLTQFEPNSFISKGLTGCGATTILLENNQPLILSCPTNELCQCKSTAERHSGKVLWYKAGTTDKEVQEYLSTVTIPKIIAVYDQTEHLYNALSRVEKQDAGSKYVLAVDEAHMLMTALSYRDKAINQLTALFDKFENTQFITATPLLPEYTPEVLLRYNYIEYEWESAVDLQVLTMKQQSPLKAVSNLITNFKRKEYIEVTEAERTEIEAMEIIFFINSVSDIATIIKSSNLQPNECKIIVSNKGSNRDLLAKAFGIKPDEVEITHASAPNKTFTFVTAKAFEGVDFYSESALSIVVSMVDSKYTLLDMNISLPQIAGRIRTPENKLKNTILFIYNTSSYGKSEKELEMELALELADAQRLIKIYDRTIDIEERKSFLDVLSPRFDHGVLQRDESTEEVNVSINQDAVKFKRYQNNITTNFNSKLKVINAIQQKAKVSECDNFFSENTALTYLRKPSLSKDAERYSELKIKINKFEVTNEGDNEQNERDKRTLEMIGLEYPLLKQGFEMLGSEKMITASKRGIRKLQQELDVFNTKDALRRKVAKQFTEGEFYSRQSIREILQPLYQEKKLSAPTATDIAFYFETGDERRNMNSQTNNLEWGYIIGKAIRPTGSNLFRAYVDSATRQRLTA